MVGCRVVACQKCSCGLDIMILDVLCFNYVWNRLMNGGILGCLCWLSWTCIYRHGLWWLLSSCPVHTFQTFVIHVVGGVCVVVVAAALPRLPVVVGIQG